MLLAIDAITAGAKEGSLVTMAGVTVAMNPAISWTHCPSLSARLLGMCVERLWPLRIALETDCGCLERLWVDRLAILRNRAGQFEHLRRVMLSPPYGSPNGRGLIRVVSPHLGHSGFSSLGSRSKMGSLPQLRQIQAFNPSLSGLLMVIQVLVCPLRDPFASLQWLVLAVSLLRTRKAL